MQSIRTPPHANLQRVRCRLRRGESPKPNEFRGSGFRGLGFRGLGLGLFPVMENQMEDEIETGIIYSVSLGLVLVIVKVLHGLGSILQGHTPKG